MLELWGDRRDMDALRYTTRPSSSSNQLWWAQSLHQKLALLDSDGKAERGPASACDEIYRGVTAPILLDKLLCTRR